MRRKVCYPETRVSKERALRCKVWQKVSFWSSRSRSLEKQELAMQGPNPVQTSLDLLAALKFSIKVHIRPQRSYNTHQFIRHVPTYCEMYASSSRRWINPLIYAKHGKKESLIPISRRLRKYIFFSYYYFSYYLLYNCRR